MGLWGYLASFFGAVWRFIRSSKAVMAGALVAAFGMILGVAPSVMLRLYKIGLDILFGIINAFPFPDGAFNFRALFSTLPIKTIELGSRVGIWYLMTAVVFGFVTHMILRLAKVK